MAEPEWIPRWQHDLQKQLDMLKLQNEIDASPIGEGVRILVAGPFLLHVWDNEWFTTLKLPVEPVSEQAIRHVFFAMKRMSRLGDLNG